MASEEELRRERELNDLFSRRAGINRDIVDDLQDQTNVLNDQIRLLKFEKSERSQIRSLTREVNKIASDNYNITVGELGVQKNLSKIRKDQLQLSKDLNSFTRLRNKLVNDGAKLNSDIVISLDDQIKFTKSLQVELQTVAELSNSIANNETVQRFSKIASFLKLLGPLKGFAAPFEKASEAARASIVANTEILKTGKGLTKEKAKELGIADKLNGIYGKVGLNAAKLTKTQKQQAIQASSSKSSFKRSL
jgi:plasmid maintenance system antidote protein VapI